MCNYHTAQQLRTIEKKESRAELSGDIEKMMTKSFPGWVSSHSTSNLTTGINLPDPGRHLIYKGGASTTLPALRAQPVAAPPDPAWVEGSSWRPPGAGDHNGGGGGEWEDTCRLLFSHPLRYKLS